jgi:hypothetical protein
MTVETIGMAIVQSRVVVVCPKHQKQMLTRLTAARPWQIVRNNIGRQAPWASVHHLLHSVTGTDEMIDMVA